MGELGEKDANTKKKAVWQPTFLVPGPPVQPVHPSSTTAGEPKPSSNDMPTGILISNGNK
jgi:hypothetical protein